MNRFTNKMVNFNTPVKLVIFGGRDSCDTWELLAESPAIEHEDWQLYSFTLAPVDEISHLILKVDYKNNKEVYNGNILIDNIFPIIFTIDCTTKRPVSIDTIRVQQPYSFDNLKEIIVEEGRHLTENDGSIQQHFQYFFQPNGELFWGEPHLYRMLEALKSYNGYELFVAIANNGSTSDVVEAFSKKFRKDFYKLKLNQSLISIRNYDPSENGWLWIPDKLELVMKLERKKY